MRFRIPFTLGLLLLAPALARAADGPNLSDERVILHTIGGDVVIAFYPEIAPQHMQQILHLVRLGVYDHTHFHRVEPGFVLQLADVGQREEQYALTPEQLKAIHPIRAEFSNWIQHRRGILSMARADGLPDSATTSFSIILGSDPAHVSHLNGQYTIFGEVVYGMDAVDKLVQVPPLFIDPKTQPLPLIPLVIEKAEVVAAKDLDTTKLVPAHDVEIQPKWIAKAHSDAWAFHRAQSQTSGTTIFSFADVNKAYLLTGGLLLVVLLSLAAFFGAGRLTQRWLISLNMLIVLIAAFLLLVLLTPFAQDHRPILAVLLFISFFGIFKLLSRFESVG